MVGGHYILNILPKYQQKATLPTESKKKKATLLKIHWQFRHLRLDMMTGLLKKVNCHDKEAREIVKTTHTLLFPEPVFIPTECSRLTGACHKFVGMVNKEMPR